MLQIWSYFSTLLIIISITLLTIDTIPDLREDIKSQHKLNASEYSDTFYQYLNTRAVNAILYLEMVVTILLLLEYIVRFSCCPHKLRFIRNIENILSFVSLIPTIICSFMFLLVPHLGLEHMTIIIYFFPFRILRVVYLVRYGQYYPAVRVIVLTVRASLRSIVMVCAMLLTLGIFFGGCLYYIEMRVDTLHSIPQGMWWGIVTMTTVGYGDIYPATPEGQVVGVLCAITGILLITLPIAFISMNFSRFDDAMDTITNEKSRNVCHHNPSKSTET